MKIRGTIVAAGILIVVPVILRIILGPSFDKALGSIAAPVLGKLRPSPPLDELQRLQSEVNRLTVETARLRHLETENQELQNVLSFQKRASYFVIPTQIIGHTADLERRAIIIDFGQAEGAVPGLLVTTSDGLVLGKISEVRGKRSTVILITDEQSRLSVVVEREKERVLGLLEGGFGTGMRMRLIPAASKIESGDIVVTDNSDSMIPAGLVVGTIESVRDEEHIPFQVAVIRAAADFDTPLIISVIKPKDVL